MKALMQAVGSDGLLHTWIANFFDWAGASFPASFGVPTHIAVNSRQPDETELASVGPAGAVQASDGAGGFAGTALVSLVAAGAALAIGAAPALSGALRLSNGEGINFSGSGGGADVVGLSVDAANVVVLGGAGATIRAERVYANSKSNFTVAVLGADEYLFGQAGADFKDNFLQFGVSPSTGGVIRLPGGVVQALVKRNISNTANTNVLAWASDTLYIGDSASGGDTVFDVQAARTFSFNIAAAVEYAFSATAADFKDNALRMGTNPATAGTIRLATSESINYRNALNTGNLFLIGGAADNAGYVGDPLNTALYLRTGGGVGFSVGGAGSDNFSFSTNGLNMGAGAIWFTAAPATIGAVRLGNTQQVAWRNTANTANIVGMQVISGDVLVIGDPAAPNSGVEMHVGAGTNFDVKTGNVFKYRLGPTTFTYFGTNASFDTGVIAMGAAPSIQGTIRLSASGGLGGIWFRNNLNTADVIGLFSGTDDVLYIGDSTNSVAMNLRTKSTGSVNIQMAGVSKYSFTVGLANFTDNALAFGTTPSTGGTIRFPVNTLILAARNNGNTANLGLLFVSTSDELLIGDTVLGGLVYRVKTAGTHRFLVNDVDIVSIAAGLVDFKTNTLQCAQQTAPGNPAAGNIKVYVDSADGKLKSKNPAGGVFVLSA